MKTREEVEALKRNWCGDAIWDIETTEGFEEYHDELLEYSNRMKSVWEYQYNVKLTQKARDIGFANATTKFIEYISGLEQRISDLEETVERLKTFCL